MALYPGARHRLIPAGTNDPPITVIGAILHVDAGNSKSLYGYFSEKSGGIESHFHIPKEGQPEQYRDTGREADANLKANSFVVNGKRYGFVSIETQGFGSGEWNAHQLDEIKKLLLWLSRTHDFSLRRCPAWNKSGVGYHTMWGAPSEWTPVAKSCPGPDRVKQFNNVLVPWFATAGKPTAPPAQEEDVALTQAEINAVATAAANAVWAKVLGNPDIGQSSAADCIIKARLHAEGASTEQAKITDQLDRIEADTDRIP